MKFAPGLRNLFPTSLQPDRPGSEVFHPNEHSRTQLRRRSSVHQSGSLSDGHLALQVQSSEADGADRPLLGLSSPKYLRSEKVFNWKQSNPRNPQSGWFCWLFVALLGGAALGSGLTGLLTRASVASPDRGQSRLFLRVGGLTPEGIGSVLQHFKEAIILSLALNATLILSERESNHHYSVSRLINNRLDWFSHDVDIRRSCLLADYLPQEDRSQLSRGWCKNTPEALRDVHMLGQKMEHCRSILDVGAESSHEDLNGCIANWLRARLGPLPSAVKPHPRKPTVGVHVRWGDSAWQFRGSMSMANMNTVLGDLRSIYGDDGIEVTIVMENADTRVLTQFNVSSYKLIDTGDAMADLYSLANNDYILAGTSSYAVLAHLIAPAGLTIYEGSEDQSHSAKYQDTTTQSRTAINLYQYTAGILEQFNPALAQVSL
ncbi:hypothetical protein P7C70_g8483, partial [Phenoliferia sp. Uapishka_3]